MKGSIRKTGKQSWEIRVDVGKDPSTGKRRQKSISIRGTKKEAERKLAEIICQLESGSFVEPAKMTFGEYMERWLRDYVGMTVRETTRESYETLVRTHIVPALGHIPLSKLSPVHLQEFYARALENGRKDGRGGLSTRTVRYIHGLIHEALDRALKQGIVARNVADAAEPPRESKREIRPLKEEEVARLLAEIRDMRLLVPVTLAVLGGMRRGEVLGLRWEDVNLSTGEVYVRQSLDRITKKGLVVGEPKTARSRRRITLPPSAVEVLKKWRIRQKEERLMAGELWNDTGFVCTSPDGKPLDPDWVTHAFKKVIEKLGITPVTFHGLRHTHATLLLTQNVHPKVVSERLGHSTVGMTLDTYSHVIPNMQKEAALKIDQILRAASSKQERS